MAAGLLAAAAPLAPVPRLPPDAWLRAVACSCWVKLAGCESAVARLRARELAPAPPAAAAPLCGGAEAARGGGCTMPRSALKRATAPWMSCAANTPPPLPCVSSHSSAGLLLARMASGSAVRRSTNAASEALPPILWSQLSSLQSHAAAPVDEEGAAGRAAPAAAVCAAPPPAAAGAAPAAAVVEWAAHRAETSEDRTVEDEVSGGQLAAVAGEAGADATAVVTAAAASCRRGRFARTGEGDDADAAGTPPPAATEDATHCAAHSSADARVLQLAGPTPADEETAAAVAAAPAGVAVAAAAGAARSHAGSPAPGGQGDAPDAAAAPAPPRPALANSSVCSSDVRATVCTSLWR